MRRFPYTSIANFKIFKKLNSPTKIQDFLNAIPHNFEEKEIYLSPLMVLKKNKAHCMEGALLASAIFWFHGKKSFIVNLSPTTDDLDHVITLFKENRHWGAVSKTNHAVLRYRDPVYETPHELVMSYFNEYFLDDGKKTLRSYSELIDITTINSTWVTTEKNIVDIVYLLNETPHIDILKGLNPRRLRPADKIEVRAFIPTEWKKYSKKKK